MSIFGTAGNALMFCTISPVDKTAGIEGNEEIASLSTNVLSNVS